MDKDLESLYKEAQSALKAKDYEHASDLLRQILKADVDYKDAAQLLARVIRLSRRRWYNDPRLWGTLGVLLLVGLGFFFAPKLQGFYTNQAPTPTLINPTITSSPTAQPPTATATATLLPTPTPVSLTWKRINIGQEFPRDTVIAFEIDPKDGDVLYVSMENVGFYQSIDGGISWRPLQIENVPADISTKLIANNDHNQEEEYTVMNTGPDGKERIYSVKTANWFISENGGESWSEFGIIGKPQSNAITFDSQGSLYVYCDSHLCKYSPDGKQKNTLGKPDVSAFTLIAISSHDPNTIYIAGRGIAVSKDGGLTWTKLNNGLGAILLTLETGEGKPPILCIQEECDYSSFPYLMEKFDYLTDGKGRKEPGQPLFISKNGGQTWDLVSQTGCYLIKDADGVTLYRIARAIEFCNNCENPDGWIWRSQDGGQVWRKVMAPHIYWNLLTLVAHPTQSGTLFALNQPDAPEQFISKDYGSSWERVNPPLEIKSCYGSTLQFIDKYRPMAIDPFDGNHVFVIDNGTLLESHDSCDTTDAFKSAPDMSMNSIAFDPNNSDTIYAGTDGGAYISFDSGQTWGQINDGLLGATVVYSIAIDKDSNVYAATPYGIFKLENK